MVSRIALFVLFLTSCTIHSQELLKPMEVWQYYQLSDTEKVEYVKIWFKEGKYNVPWGFAHEFATVGGRDVIPFLLEELPKYELYWDLNDKYDERLSFITNALVYFRDRNLLTIYERFYIVGILEAKIIDYIKKNGRYDLLVTGLNANMWMYINPDLQNQLTADERDEIILAKYRAMGYFLNIDK